MTTERVPSIEVDVCGEKWPIKFGFDAMSKFQELSGFSIEQIRDIAGNLKTFGQTVDLLYCGFWYGHKREKKPFTMTRDEFEVLVSDNPQIMTIAFDVFNLSQPSTNGEAKEEDKKKVKTR